MEDGWEVVRRDLILVGKMPIYSRREGEEVPPSRLEHREQEVLAPKREVDTMKERV